MKNYQIDLLNESEMKDISGGGLMDIFIAFYSGICYPYECNEADECC